MYRPDKAGSSTSSSTSFLIISIWPVQVFLPHIRIPVSLFLYFLQSHYQPYRKDKRRSQGDDTPIHSHHLEYDRQ